jgi:NAD(P)H-quinone oxidoreductase subunit 5
MVAGIATLAIALITAGVVLVDGPMRSPLVGVAGIGASIYLDRLSATMFCLVSFIGAIVLSYSRNYLDGDPGQTRFTRFLCATLCAVLVLIVSGNMLLFTLAWIGTSVGLNSLLLFYPERRSAVIAARKKFLASRVGDAALIVAMLLLYHTFGTLEYSTLFAQTAALRGAEPAPALHASAFLFVLAALLKSAQFPWHGWLIEVMETPNPVSALLHAGIINAGGYLILRFANVLSVSLGSLELLAIVGGITALFGSIVMLTQTSIKVTLAYSTIAQMGFMMLECGLGAFPAAMLHIVAHSLYKAHAFLSSGSVIDIARASWTPSPGGKPHPRRQLFAIVGVLGVAFGVSRLFGATLAAEPGIFTLGAVLLLGLIHLVANGIDERPSAYVIGRTLLYAAVVGVAYFALQLAAVEFFANSLPPQQALRGPLDLSIVVAVVVSFAIVTFLQGLVPGQGGSARWQSLYAHVSNGFYVNTLANRFVLATFSSRKPAAVEVRDAQ